VPIEEYGDQIGHNIVLAIGGAGEIVEAWLGAVVFYEYSLYPSEQVLAVLNSHFYHQNLNKINKCAHQKLELGIFTHTFHKFWYKHVL